MGMKLMQKIIIIHPMARKNLKVSNKKLSKIFSDNLIQIITNNFQNKQN